MRRRDDVPQWARATGCDWSSDTCDAAAGGGHLEALVLQWARANGCELSCEWDTWVITRAKRGGHTVVADWARANGYTPR